MCFNSTRNVSPRKRQTNKKVLLVSVRQSERRNSVPLLSKYGYSLRRHVLNHTANEIRLTQRFYGAACLSNTSKLKNFENLTDSWPSSVITDLLSIRTHHIAKWRCPHVPPSPNCSRRQRRRHYRCCYAKPGRVVVHQVNAPLMLQHNTRWHRWVGDSRTSSDTKKKN